MHWIAVRLRRPDTIVWAVLMLATVVSWTLGTRHDVFGAGARAATIGVLVLAFVKVRLIGTHFMELHHAPRGLARAFDGWVVVVCAMIIGLYLSPAI